MTKFTYGGQDTYTQLLLAEAKARGVRQQAERQLGQAQADYDLASAAYFRALDAITDYICDRKGQV